MEQYPKIFYPSNPLGDESLIDFDNYKTGTTESYFEYKLEKYFKGHIITNKVIDNGWKKPYQPDFILYYPKHGLYIDIEIDEPYAKGNNKPIHFNDEKRNNFFLERGWSIIRFAEIQVTKYPELCCKIISEHIRNLTGENIWIEGFHELENLEMVKSWNISEAEDMASSSYRHTYLNLLKKIDERTPSINIIIDGIFLNKQITETKTTLSTVNSIDTFNDSVKISVFFKSLMPYLGHLNLSESDNEKIYVEITIYISNYHSFYNFSFDTDFIEIGKYIINVYFIRTEEIIYFEIFEKIEKENLKQVILIADDPAYLSFLEERDENEIILVRNYHNTFMPDKFSFINIDGIVENSLEIIYK